MKKFDWKTLAELVGIGAIVASLVFVGLQMRQAQQIARAENFLSSNASLVDVRNAISDHADIWSKGNSGAILNSAERVIYRNLIQNYNDVRFFNFLQESLLQGTAAGESVAVAEMTYFLYLNPGAYAMWEEVEQETLKAKELIPPERSAVGARYQQFIRSGVSRLTAEQSE